MTTTPKRFNVLLHGLAVLRVNQQTGYFEIYSPNVPGHTVAVGNFGRERLLLPAEGKAMPKLELTVPYSPMEKRVFKGPQRGTDLLIRTPTGTKFDPVGSSVCLITIPPTDLLSARVADTNGNPIFKRNPAVFEPEKVPLVLVFSYTYTGQAPTLTLSDSLDPTPIGFSMTENLHIWSTQVFNPGPRHTSDELNSLNGMFDKPIGLESAGGAEASEEFNDLSGMGIFVDRKETLTVAQLMQNAVVTSNVLRGGKAHCYSLWVT